MKTINQPNVSKAIDFGSKQFRTGKFNLPTQWGCYAPSQIIARIAGTTRSAAEKELALIPDKYLCLYWTMYQIAEITGYGFDWTKEQEIADIFAQAQNVSVYASKARETLLANIPYDDKRVNYQGKPELTSNFIWGNCAEELVHACFWMLGKEKDEEGEDEGVA